MFINVLNVFAFFFKSNCQVASSQRRRPAGTQESNYNATSRGAGAHDVGQHAGMAPPFRGERTRASRTEPPQKKIVTVTLFTYCPVPLKRGRVKCVAATTGGVPNICPWSPPIL